MIGVTMVLIDEARRRGVLMLNVLLGRPTAYRVRVVDGHIERTPESLIEECTVTPPAGRPRSIGLQVVGCEVRGSTGGIRTGE